MDHGAKTSPKLTSIPADLLTAADYERYAQAMLPAPVFAHLAGGAGQEQTLRANAAAFAGISIYNRILEDCSRGSTRTQVLGRSYRHPIFLAPVAHQGIVHPDAELAVARGASALEACMIASTLSSRTLEAIAAESDGGKWFQLYLQPDRAASLDLLRRAEAAGYVAIVATLDAPVQPQSARAARAGFSLAREKTPNLDAYAAAATLALTRDQSPIFDGLMRQAPHWSDLEWLTSQTPLPVLVKGVTHPDDAARALASGAAGVIVSNHGGRTLDGAPAAFAALPEIRARLGAQACILMDGGVRSGADAFKAIALGAGAVLIGRPQIYALAVAGALGVAHLLKLMRDELEVTMALAGCPTIQSISPAAIFRGIV